MKLRRTDPETGGPVRNPIVTVLAFAFVVFIVIAVVVAIVLAVRGGHSDDPAASPTTAPAVSAAPPSGPVQGADDPAYRGFGDPTVDRFGRRVDVPKWSGGWALDQERVSRAPYDPNTPIVAPTGMVWEKVNDGAIVPFSTSDGPSRVSGGQAFGFAHTPQGAALAGWSIVQRIGVAVNSEAQTMYDTQTVMTPQQRDATNAAIAAQGPWFRNITDTALSYQAQADAVKVSTYAPDFAVVEYATKTPDADDGTPQWATFRTQLLWSDGDWKVQYDSTGQDPTGTITSLEGWTAW